MKKNLFAILFFLSPFLLAQRNQSWKELQRANKSWVQPKKHKKDIKQDEIKQKLSAPKKKEVNKKRRELRRRR